MSGPSPVVRICSRKNVIIGPILKQFVSLNTSEEDELQSAYCVEITSPSAFRSAYNLVLLTRHLVRVDI